MPAEGNQEFTFGPIRREATFQTTLWGMVLEAGNGSSTSSQSALGELCRAYWYPLYAYVRRTGRRHEDAQDLVQGFFEQLIARQDLAGVRPEKGRFRSFLLGALCHYLANDWNRARTLKRGGGMAWVPLDSEEAQDRYSHEPATSDPPEVVFDRAWARETLDAVRKRLDVEGTADEASAARHAVLKEFLFADEGGTPYAAIAERLGLTEAGVKSAVHRMRKRFRELFREEISRTVVTREHIDEELRHLIRVMTG